MKFINMFGCDAVDFVLKLSFIFKVILWPVQGRSVTSIFARFVHLFFRDIQAMRPKEFYVVQMRCL